VTDLPPPFPPAPPAPPPEIVHARLPYHRLMRAQPTYRWWRPLVAVLLTAAFFLGVSILVAVPVFIVLFTTSSVDFLSPTAQQDMTELLLPDMARPWTLLFGLGSIILVLPLIPVALRIAGIRPAGPRVNILHSIAFRLRWRWLAIAFIPAAVVWLVTTVGQLALGFATGEELGEFTTPLGTYAVSVLIVLVLVPVQAATEEYLYRGVLLQSFGSWLRWAPLPIIASAVLFGFSHAYDAWGIVQVTVMGIGFAVATIRTGGLEAAIALHTVNNIGVFTITGTGMFGETGMTEETGGPVAVIAQVVTVGLWLLALEFFVRRHKVERISRIGVPVLPGMPGPPAR
jgi:membrane protease YdiL (CAAX protease family)